MHCAPLANLFRLLPLRLLQSLDTPYLWAFAQLFAEFHQPLESSEPGHSEAVSPTALLDTLRSRQSASFQGDQEDAQEFLTVVLDMMHEEFVRSTPGLLRCLG